MSDLERFIVQGHRKVIEHYRRLADSSVSDVERERFQRRMDEEEAALNRFLETRLGSVRQAA